MKSHQNPPQGPLFGIGFQNAFCLGLYFGSCSRWDGQRAINRNEKEITRSERKQAQIGKGTLGLDGEVPGRPGALFPRLKLKVPHSTVPPRASAGDVHLSCLPGNR